MDVGEPGNVVADPVAAHLDAAVVAVDGLVGVKTIPFAGIVKEQLEVVEQARLVGLHREQVVPAAYTSCIPGDYGCRRCP